MTLHVFMDSSNQYEHSQYRDDSSARYIDDCAPIGTNHRFIRGSQWVEPNGTTLKTVFKVYFSSFGNGRLSLISISILPIDSQSYTLSSAIRDEKAISNDPSKPSPQTFIYLIFTPKMQNIDFFNINIHYIYDTPFDVK